MVSVTDKEARGRVAAAGFDPDDEWLLMYVAGLTGRRIAALCRVHPNAVHNRLRRFVTAVPGLTDVHQSRAPAGDADGSVPEAWVLRLEEVIAHRTGHGELPHAGLPEPEYARLGRWLDAQRRKARAGTLSQEKLALLNHVKGWQAGLRKRTEQERWALRTVQLTEFHEVTGRLPDYRSTDPEERAVGVWLHGRRIQAHHGTLDADQAAALSAAVPGWRGRSRSAGPV
ncbi:helicase associated domain-containing protein [Arthrobacter sp. ISL-69]|uniref:helicase associated domain-containing protein n=1 Tax=Arthrobacter sp. ISL-69 TaxID=2819113 RepID=UPI001BEC8F1F|nr:helicase associated domain-containing protein [Arthrobacter sp. ISL-69]MBT2536277.1 helicase associated domain-containing protein [Arthrobacter sp. ISL-69]